MGTRGLVSLSFGMIFSIFIIVAIIAITFFTISSFLGLQKCTEISLFYRDFQDTVDRAWSSEITREDFVGSLPGGIKSVCIGNLSFQAQGKEYEELKIYKRQESNTFLYPIKGACESAHITIQHIDFSEQGNWYCFPNEGGKIKIRLEKGSFDSLVSVKEAN